MASSLVSTLFTLSIALSLLGTASAQSTCDGQPIPQAAGMAARYPPVGQPARLVAGDQEASDLYNSILATGNPSLKYPQAPVVNGTISFAGYDCKTDSQCWWSCSSCKQPKLPDLPADFSTCSQPSTYGLTFDDGPTCYHNELYDFLAKQNQLATLYYIGTNMLKWPQEAQKGYLAGHEICVHTWSHPFLTTLSNEQVFAELYYTKKIIRELTGASVRCYRPSNGDLDDRIRFIADALDLRAHLWVADTFDYTMDNGVSPSVVVNNYERIINADHSTSGNVVLSHEVSTDTCDMAMREYPHIKAKWTNIVPVSTCNNDPVVMAEDNQPVFPTFAEYTNGERGAQRTSDNFWNNGELVFIGNDDIHEASVSSSSSSLPGTLTSASSASSTADSSIQSQGARIETTSSALSSSISYLVVLVALLARLL